MHAREEARVGERGAGDAQGHFRVLQRVAPAQLQHHGLDQEAVAGEAVPADAGGKRGHRVVDHVEPLRGDEGVRG